MTDQEINDIRDEMRAIKSLQRLAKKWPKQLWLWSASGSLHVMKTAHGGSRGMTKTGSVDAAYIIATIDIPNDGGDW